MSTTTFYITYALSHIILRIIIFFLRNIIISRQRSYLGPYEIYELLLLRSLNLGFTLFHYSHTVT